MERCQIRIRRRGKENQKYTCILYRHLDGYPEKIIPDIKKAYDKYGGNLNAGDPRYVASFICASDPTRFTFWKRNNKILIVSHFLDLVINEPVNGKKAFWELAVYSGPNRVLESKENYFRMRDLTLEQGMKRLEEYV